VTGAGKGVRPVLFSPVGQLLGIVDVLVWDGERVVVIREEEAGLTQTLKIQCPSTFTIQPHYTAYF